MHKSTRLTPFTRKECYRLYKVWREKQEIAIHFHVHRNTITKIIKRAKVLDFSIHKSTREDYRSLEYGLRKLDTLYEKIKKKHDKYWSIVRYEKQYAGELVHIDVKKIKKIKNIKGQNPKKKQYLVWVIDDCTRVCYTEKTSRQKSKNCSIVFQKSIYTIPCEMSQNTKSFVW